MTTPIALDREALDSGLLPGSVDKGVPGCCGVPELTLLEAVWMGVLGKGVPVPEPVIRKCFKPFFKA